MGFAGLVKALENAISQNDGIAEVSLETSDSEYLVLKFKDGKKFWFSDGEYGTIPLIKMEEP